MSFLILINEINGTPEKIRTSDTRFRKPLLYPTELREHIELLIWVLPLCNKDEKLHCSLDLVNNGACFAETIVILNDKLMTSFSEAISICLMLKNSFQQPKNLNLCFLPSHKLRADTFINLYFYLYFVNHVG